MASKRTLVGIGITVAIVLFCGVVVALLVRQNRQRRARLTAEAPAEILNVDVVTDTTRRASSANRRRSGRTTHETVIDYRFDAGGRTVRGTTDKSGDVHKDYKVGGPAKACYNPSNPEESEVFTADHECGS